MAERTGQGHCDCGDDGHCGKTTQQVIREDQFTKDFLESLRKDGAVRLDFGGEEGGVALSKTGRSVAIVFPGGYIIEMDGPQIASFAQIASACAFLIAENEGASSN